MLPYRTIALLLSASLTAGCMVGPDYKQPEVALADHYVADAQPLTASDTSVGSLDVWWEGFGDPLLSRLVTEALGQNLQLAQAQARVAQARATGLSDRGACAVRGYQWSSCTLTAIR